MVKNLTIDSLKKEALRVYSGMITVYPQFSQEEHLNLSDIVPKFNGSYAVNNSTVTFVSDCCMYVIPYMDSVIECLRAAGFCEEQFYVPFSNGDYPKLERSKWNSLLAEANKENDQTFLDYCSIYCDEHNIGTIDEEILKNCFEMPETGVVVKHHYFENCYYPVIRCRDYPSVEKLGHYCKNNGKVVFIHRNSKTYVAKGYGILDTLRAAGYTESGMFVPFSNGEVIQDVFWRTRWESISKF